MIAPITHRFPSGLPVYLPAPPGRRIHARKLTQFALIGVRLPSEQQKRAAFCPSDHAGIC